MHIFKQVRYGVAPDHPEVKNVINTFNKTAQNPNFNFYGNIALGRDVSLSELRDLYDIVILCYGADVDNQLGIEGENSKGVIAARDFVGWYNGLPGNDQLNPDLSGDVAVIIGQGNVAIDVARILLSPIDKLKSTDITEHALEKLRASKIKEVYMVGRRGPCQAAFTIAELREMLKLPNVLTKWRKEDFNGIPEQIETLPRPRKRLTELMLKNLEIPQENEKIRKFLPIFYRSPLRINSNNGHVTSIDLSITELLNNQAVASDKIENINTQLICRSIGYKSICVDNSIYFDSKYGRVHNTNGRVLKLNNSNEIDYGLYAGGWVATGPSGVILTTMNNAFSVAQTIIDDINAGQIKINDDKKAGLDPKKYQTVTWSDWLKIDNVEIEEGKRLNKPREKIVSVDKMLNIVF